MNILIIGIIVAIGLLTAVILLAIYSEEPKSLRNDVGHDSLDLYQMHDVIVDGHIIASFANEPKPYVIMEIKGYFKNPQNASHLTVWGEFGLNGDYCLQNLGKCDRILAYLYKDKNGIYRQGETFDWITDYCDAKCFLDTDRRVSELLGKKTKRIE